MRKEIISKILPVLLAAAVAASIAGDCSGTVQKKKKKKATTEKTFPFSFKKGQGGAYHLQNVIPAPIQYKKVPVQTQPAPEEKIGLSVGIKGGASAGLTGAIGDVSYSLSRIIPGVAVRGSIGYLTGSVATNSDNLKMTTVNLDAIYSVSLTRDEINPTSIYIGGGVIYPWKVNEGRGAGAWGAHAYLGSKYLIQDNTSVYGELAYTGIKYQADEAAIKGMDAMLGYSYSF